MQRNGGVFWNAYYISSAIVGVIASLLLYFFYDSNIGYLSIFAWLGICITIGHIVNKKKKGNKDVSRKIILTSITLVILFFLIIIEKQNAQIEGFVFYMIFWMITGIFSDVVLHFFIAKLFGTLLFGRGFCGWVCWLAPVMDWLPIKKNNHIPSKYHKIRYLSLFISIAIPITMVLLGDDWYNTYSVKIEKGLHQTGTNLAVIAFFTSYFIYSILAIILAFYFKKKRAFCLILCPISLLMKPLSKFSLIKMRPSGRTCLTCGKCNHNCPMDVNIMQYIKKHQPVYSSECILCGNCVYNCPNKAVV
jgi:polyferredoxin